MRNPFRRFNSSPEVICLTVMMYVRYPLSRCGHSGVFSTTVGHIAALLWAGLARLLVDPKPSWR
jgi:hypothetical protein